MVIMMLAVVDFARVYTTMLTVESAAREAADYGTFGSQKWNDALYAVPDIGTEAQMLHRACVAASKLPDYVGAPGDTSCTNPALTYELSGDRGVTWQAYDVTLACDDEVREPPCWLKVTLHYQFRVLVPLNIELFGSTYGVPSTVMIERSSIFAMTDLRSHEPSPRPARAQGPASSSRPGACGVRPGRPGVLPAPVRIDRGRAVHPHVPGAQQRDA